MIGWIRRNEEARERMREMWRAREHRGDFRVGLGAIERGFELLVRCGHLPRRERRSILCLLFGCKPKEKCRMFSNYCNDCIGRCRRCERRVVPRAIARP